MWLSDRHIGLKLHHQLLFDRLAALTALPKWEPGLNFVINDSAPAVFARPAQLKVQRSSRNQAMGANQDTLDLAVAAAGLAISGLTTLPAVVALVTRSREARQKDEIYRDEDGEATPESVAAFSTKWRRTFVLLWAGAGLSCQIALVVIAEAGKKKFFLHNWLTTGAWVRLWSDFGVQLILTGSSLFFSYKLYPLWPAEIQSARTTRASLCLRRVWSSAADCFTN
jgi:hypothetical protein